MDNQTDSQFNLPYIMNLHFYLSLVYIVTGKKEYLISQIAKENGCGEGDEGGDEGEVGRFRWLW